MHRFMSYVMNTESRTQCIQEKHSPNHKVAFNSLKGYKNTLKPLPNSHSSILKHVSTYHITCFNFPYSYFCFLLCNCSSSISFLRELRCSIYLSHTLHYTASSRFRDPLRIFLIKTCWKFLYCYPSVVLYYYGNIPFHPSIQYAMTTQHFALKTSLLWLSSLWKLHQLLQHFVKQQLLLNI